ncbi:MAG: hypothetical protein ACRER2_08955 [Methylococcales bacterium]
MIEKSGSISLALATIAILGQAPSLGIRAGMAFIELRGQSISVTPSPGISAESPEHE